MAYKLFPHFMRSFPLPSGKVTTYMGSKIFRVENGSSQGLNLALTGVFVPSPLDSGGLCRHETPHFEVRRVCRIPGCYLTTSAPHTAL